jgi:hypothetical protein
MKATSVSQIYSDFTNLSTGISAHVLKTLSQQGNYLQYNTAIMPLYSAKPPVFKSFAHHITTII